MNDIYNAYEFGLFYQKLPTKSLHFKGEQCTGGKFRKIRLTGVAVGNAAGEKLPMFVIGKVEQHDALKVSQVYLANTSQKENPGWIIKYFPIMSESLTLSLMLRAGKSL